MCLKDSSRRKIIMFITVATTRGDDAASERIRRIYDYFKDKDWQNFDAEQLIAHVPFLKLNPMPGLNLDAIGKPGDVRIKSRSLKT